MATKVDSIEIVFQGVDEVSNITRSISRSLNQFSNSVNGLVSPLNTMADTVKTAEAAVIGFAAVIGTLAVSEAGKFTSATAEIATLSNSIGADLPKLENALVSFSRGSAASLEEITKSTYNFVSAIGFDGVEATENFLKAADTLATAGVAGLDQAVDILTTSLNAYGVGVENAAEYSNILFKAVQSGKTTIPELASNLGKVVGTAANAGVGFNELSAAVAGFTAAGAGNTAEATTAINALLANIIAPTDGAAKAAENLGIQFDIAALQSKGFAGFLADVAEKSQGNVTSLSPHNTANITYKLSFFDVFMRNSS